MYDTLAQIALMRGGYESAGDYLRQAGEAYGSYGAQTGLWYEWSIRVLEAKLAARRGATDEALRLANEIAAKAPPAEAIQAELDRVRSPARGGPRAGGRDAARTASRAASTRAPCRARGANSFACAARCTDRPTACPRRTTTSRRARACSS